MIKTIFKNSFVIISLLVFLTIPQTVLAHAILEKANPLPNSQLASAPKEIVLTFNERLEKELYSIKVFDDDGDTISKSSTKMSVDQKQVSQALPSLSDGNYTVSYKVLSADGHPIEGSYVFAVGESTNLSQLSLKGSQNVSDQNGVYTSIVKTVYYIALLLVGGWILWGALFQIKDHETKITYRKWTTYFLWFFLIANIELGILEFAKLLDNWTLPGIWSVITGTTFGISWASSMLLAVVGFVLLHRSKWIDCLWVLLILVVKSINGHAFAFDPPYLTVTLDLIHLLGASIWAGGLFYILIFWKSHRKHVQHFLPVFSKAAFTSIIVLILTGVASTLIFLPKISYLLYTQWGILLLIKTALVLLVILVAGLLRFALKRKNDIGKFLKIDFTMMLLILCIVGVFTQLSPLPENKTLIWSVDKSNLEFTTTISPKIPGNNMFMVVASSHKDGVKIKRIELFLINRDNPDLAPIQVPFDTYDLAVNVHYMTDGAYLPFAGKWTAEVRILDSDDNETVYTKDFIVY